MSSSWTEGGSIRFDGLAVVTLAVVAVEILLKWWQRRLVIWVMPIVILEDVMTFNNILWIVCLGLRWTTSRWYLSTATKVWQMAVLLLGIIWRSHWRFSHSTVIHTLICKLYIRCLLFILLLHLINSRQRSLIVLKTRWSWWTNSQLIIWVRWYVRAAWSLLRPIILG